MTSPMFPSSAPGAPPPARPWWQVGLLAGVAAALLNLALYLLAVGPAGLDLLIENPRNGLVEDLLLVFGLLWRAVPGLLAAAAAALLARRMAAPRRWFVALAAVVFLLCLLPLASQPVPGSTKSALGLLHLVAAVAITLPVVARLHAGRG